MPLTLPGTVALVGAGEYLPKMVAVDKMLLERLTEKPRVVVLPTAAVPDGAVVTERWVRMGVEHFQRLGADVEPVMLQTREDANNASIVARLAEANFVYFSGGKPRYLLETLKDTAAWRAIKGIYDAGGVIAGCSAGAMVMGGEYFDFPQVWRTLPALGLVPGVAIIPHFDELPALFRNTIKQATSEVTVVGIDGGTALVGSGATWTVLGNGSVTVFMEKGKIRYTAGQQVPLEALKAA